MPPAIIHELRPSIARNRPAALALAVLGMSLPAAAAVPSASPAPDDRQPTIELRGQRMSIWPADDLRARGFDVRDIPREENAAWVYLEAANAYLDLPAGLNEAFDYAVNKAWPGEASELAEWMDREENRKARDLALQASRMEDCQMPCFGDPNGSVISVLLPSLSPCRTLSKMLVADGRRLESERKYDAAMERYEATMRMGNHLNRGVTLIESLVGIACWSLGNTAAREMVLRRHLPEEPLAGISEQLGELRSLQPTVQRGLEGERNFGPGIVEEIVSNPSQLLRNLQAIDGQGSGPKRVRPESGWDHLESRVGHLLLPDRTMKRHMLRFYDAILENAKLPQHDARVLAFDEEKLLFEIPYWNVFARMLLPSLSRARTLAVRCTTETLATNLAAGLRLYAARHEGKSPASLGELREESPDLEVVDPFSGREFVYERTTEGWRFYSVGPDGADNGGKMGERWDSQMTDMVYTFPPEAVPPFQAEGAEVEGQP